jgi:hypothetical protein
MRYYIPLYARKQAMMGLKQRRKASKSKKAGLTRAEAKKLGIQSGVVRAVQLSKNKTISEKDAKSIARFYSRFKNQRTPKAEMALRLWGGRKWGNALYKKIYKSKKK